MNKCALSNVMLVFGRFSLRAGMAGAQYPLGRHKRAYVPSRKNLTAAAAKKGRPWVSLRNYA